MGYKRNITYTLLVVVAVLLLETIGRENSIEYVRVSNLVVPLSETSIELWKTIGKYAARLLGEPLLYLWHHLAEAVKRYVKGFYESIAELFYPLAQLIISPLYFFQGYYDQAKASIFWYASLYLPQTLVPSKGEVTMKGLDFLSHSFVMVLGTMLSIGVTVKLCHYLVNKYISSESRFWILVGFLRTLNSQRPSFIPQLSASQATTASSTIRSANANVDNGINMEAAWDYTTKRLNPAIQGHQVQVFTKLKGLSK
jgi:hypothetical protein